MFHDNIGPKLPSRRHSVPFPGFSVDDQKSLFLYKRPGDASDVGYNLLWRPATSGWKHLFLLSTRPEPGVALRGDRLLHRAKALYSTRHSLGAIVERDRPPQGSRLPVPVHDNRSRERASIDRGESIIQSVLINHKSFDELRLAR